MGCTKASILPRLHVKDKDFLVDCLDGKGRVSLEPDGHNLNLSL